MRRKGPKWLITETRLYPLAALPMVPSTPVIKLTFGFPIKKLVGWEKQFTRRILCTKANFTIENVLKTYFC